MKGEIEIARFQEEISAYRFEGQHGVIVTDLPI